MPPLTREEKERVAELCRAHPEYNGVKVADRLRIEADDHFWRVYLGVRLGCEIKPIHAQDVPFESAT